MIQSFRHITTARFVLQERDAHDSPDLTNWIWHLLIAAPILLFTHLSLDSPSLTGTNKERLPVKGPFMTKSKRTLSPKLKVKKPVPVLFKTAENHQ